METSEINQSSYHRAVLLQESIEALQIDPAGIYVDVTMGAAGHTKEILSHLTTGKLYSFDQDSDAWANAPQSPQFTLIKENFRDAKNWLRFNGVKKVNGIMGDFKPETATRRHPRGCRHKNFL